MSFKNTFLLSTAVEIAMTLLVPSQAHALMEHSCKFGTTSAQYRIISLKSTGDFLNLRYGEFGTSTTRSSIAVNKITALAIGSEGFNLVVRDINNARTRINRYDVPWAPTPEGSKYTGLFGLLIFGFNGLEVVALDYGSEERSTKFGSQRGIEIIRVLSEGKYHECIYEKTVDEPGISAAARNSGPVGGRR